MALRLSKYDPKLRTPEGNYIGQDWTSVSDIGKRFGGTILTPDQYVRVESAYVAVLRSLVRDAGNPDLLIRQLEGGHHSKHRFSPRMPAVAESLYDGQLIVPEAFGPVVRACLREVFWFKLQCRGDGCGVHFGYDYYVYVVGIKASTLTQELAAKTGLYLEAMPSPYDPL